MNPHVLTKLYDKLGPFERIPLILAAEARKDETEVQRLHHSAPIRMWRFSDYLMPNIALQTLSQQYIVEQLDHIATYWHACWRLNDELGEKPEDWLLSADVAAYVFTCNAEAWRRFCKELNIDGATLTVGNYRGWILQYCEEEMPKVAPSPETIMARLRENGHEDGRLVSPESLLESWRDTFKKMTRSSLRA
jgi:hypothetical protein